MTPSPLWSCNDIMKSLEDKLATIGQDAGGVQSQGVNHYIGPVAKKVKYGLTSGVFVQDYSTNTAREPRLPIEVTDTKKDAAGAKDCERCERLKGDYDKEVLSPCDKFPPSHCLE